VKRILLFIMAFTWMNLSNAADVAKAPLAAPGGRFVLGQISDARADEYLLDTQTGKVWRIVLNGSSTVLQPIQFVDSQGRISGVLPSDQVKEPSIANIYAAYRDGKMSSADAKDFEREVCAGTITLPHGAKLKQGAPCSP
jgi:hypothetical protein